MPLCEQKLRLALVNVFRHVAAPKNETYHKAYVFIFSKLLIWKNKSALKAFKSNNEIATLSNL